MSRETDGELPQLNRVLKDKDPRDLLYKAAAILSCDVDKIRERHRVSARDKDNRDLLLYLLWETGLYTNRKMGAILGLSYSAVSRRLSIVKPKIVKRQDLKKSLQEINALIKV